jgi:dihydrofolate synthase / folylpolyglutamate synthase
VPSTFTTLDQWLDYINRQHSAEIVMGLDRVSQVWRRMKVTKLVWEPPINITIAGTNGKGSTAAMLSTILHIAGYKTGFYSSPHLLRYNERVRINGVEAREELLIESFVAVEAACVIEPAIPLTYFEYATLAALWCFSHEAVDVAVLEVGLGGRLDAVNIIDADVSIVVSVDLDHQRYLGDTIEKIGWEKAHVYRANKPAIFADRVAPQSVIDYAASIGAPLHMLGRDYDYRRMESQWLWQGTIMGHASARHALPVPALRGMYQLKNASAALAALAALSDKLPVSQNHVKRGLLEVDWPGRMQVMPGRPTVVLDVAHNPHAARALEDALGTMGFYENTYAVFGMLVDKDIDAVIQIIKGRIDHWHIAGLAGARGASVAHVAALLDDNGLTGRYTRHTSIASAYDAARDKAGENDRILGFGSFYTVADLMKHLNRLN